MDPKVSIIILNWNSKEDTLECLESVYRIDYPNYEVIVVDNGSADGSAEAIRNKFRDVVLIVNKTNLGFCGGNNIGIKHALNNGAEFLLILNNDTVVEPSIIRELKKVVDSDKEIGAVSPLIAYYHKPQLMQFFGSKIDWGNGDMFRQYDIKDVVSTDGIWNIDFVTGCAMFCRRGVIETVGFLDEKFFAYYEDTDWSVRCQKIGLRTVLYPKVLVYHKGSMSTGGIYSPSVFYYLFRNRMLFIRKHASIPRKIQFSFNYVNDSLRKYKELLVKRDEEGAKAVMDGLWSALCNYFGDKKEEMPSWTKKHLNIFTKVFLFFLCVKGVFNNSMLK